MPTSIGSNFEYRGPEFLDARQGDPKTLADLKNWNTLVPKGFQVFVEGCWYVYLPEVNDPKTGHFTKMFQDELTEDANINVGVSMKGLSGMKDDINSDIDELAATVWPLDFKLMAGGGTYEKGRSVAVNIIWELRRKGAIIVPEKVLVNGSATGVTTSKSSYASAPITSNTDFTVSITVDKYLSHTQVVKYTFENLRFFGTSAKTTLTSADVITLTNSDFQKNNKLSSTLFNCTGGKYPWFCIPTTIYNATPFQVWVGGLRNTDLITQTLSVRNNYGDVTNYTCVRLGTIQTGNIYIELK